MTSLLLGYLGPLGSNSHQAVSTARQHWYENDSTPLEEVPYGTISHLLEALVSKQVDIAILPYENGLEGTVVEVLDFLGKSEHSAFVQAEFLQPIEHALMIQTPQSQTHLEAVYSHQMALGQCKDSLKERFGTAVHLIPTASTAEAAKQLAGLSFEEAQGKGVLATLMAAQLHGLHVIEPNCSDATHNITRFVMVTAQADWSSHFPRFKNENPPLKTSLCVGLHEYPGVLTEYLQVFQRYWVNLTKIESRPTREHYGEYRFYLDAEGDLPSIAEGRLLAELKARSRYFHLQGAYRCLG
jgi:prephenate dehydratase